MSSQPWVIVLIKDFDTAKQRLGPAMDPRSRRDLAVRNAEKAVQAGPAGRVLVVAGSEEAGELACRLGAFVHLEERQQGQNAAAARGIQSALAAGAESVLILSSDLPLVTKEAVEELISAAARIDGPVVVAAPATGRGGTNALYIRPPDAIRLHFGADSLALFEKEAAQRGVRFVVHQSQALALDVDEPSDLEHLRRAV